MRREYETNLKKMESEGAQRVKLADIALKTLYQIYNDISIRKLITYNDIDAVDESAAFIQLRYFLVTIPNVDSIYVYNMKNDRIYNVSTEGELARPWNNGYYTKSSFYDAGAVQLIDNYFKYLPYIAVPRYYTVNTDVTKCVYTYIMYDLSKLSDKRNVIMLNLEPEYLFQASAAEASDTTSLIIDKDNRVIYSNSEEFKVLDRLKDGFDRQEFQGTEKSGYFITNIGSTKSVVVFTGTDKYGWRSVSIIEYNSLLSQVKKLQSVTIIISLLIAVTGVVAAFFYSHRISVPIRDMSTNIRTLQNERRQTETITRRIKLKDLLENGGLDKEGSQKKGSELLELLGITFTGKEELVLLCIRMDGCRHLLETSNAQIVGAYKFAAVNILNELMGEAAGSYCLDMGIDRCLLLININHEDAIGFMDVQIKQMQRLVNEYFQVFVSVILSDLTKEPDQLFYLYGQIEETLSRSIFLEKGKTFRYSDLRLDAVQDYEYPENKEKQLLEYLTYGKAEEAEKVYLSIITETYTYPVVIYNMVISRLAFMINNIVNLIKKHSQVPSFASSILLSNLLQEVDTIAERNEKFHELFFQIQKEQENKKNGKLDQVIENINCRIETEYANPSFSIEMLADEIGMSVAYICRIYKQYTGNTIYETLLNKRMEKARQLLGESSESVNTIAAKVGFTTASYFHRAFKRVNGVTPNEYRRI